MTLNPRKVLLCHGPELAAYGFPHGHPFGPDRQSWFLDAAQQQGLLSRCIYLAPVMASTQDLLLFNTPEHVERVRSLDAQGGGALDRGDTPAYTGVFAAASTVVGSTLAATQQLLAGQASAAFVPIAGLHHARPDGASGFCVFNDCGVVIAALRERHGVRRVAYVDIDAHHGDGVFYAFEEDPDLAFADIHEDGQFLYPGTGAATETGRGLAVGTKLNLPLDPGAGDADFQIAWGQVEAYVDAFAPEFILFQCGADSLAGDPLAHLRFSAAAHAWAAERLLLLSERHCPGRLLGVGGGGYAQHNVAAAWTAVVATWLDSAQVHN